MALLELRGVSRAFGGLQVVNGLDLEVGEGEIVSVIGPNGAGKTTVFNLITGIFRPDEGEIAFEGEIVSGLPPHTITTRGIARTFRAHDVYLIARAGQRLALEPDAPIQRHGKVLHADQHSI